MMISRASSAGARQNRYDVLAERYEKVQTDPMHGDERMRALLTVCLIFSALVMEARADEQTQILAESGNWGALAHSVSMTAPPDICLAVNPVSGLAFRSDEHKIELRVADKSWSLPAGIAGSMEISIGGWEDKLDIGWNTNDMIAARIPPEVIVSMFASMDKSTSMSIKIGNEKIRKISLSGSTKATNAFRTCAGIPSNSDIPGGNPFK